MYKAEDRSGRQADILGLEYESTRLLMRLALDILRELFSLGFCSLMII